MDNDRGIPKTGIPFAVQMVREKIGALRVMPTREEIQKLLAIRMQTGAGLVEFTHSHNLHKIISTHLLTWLIAGAIVVFRLSVIASLEQATAAGRFQ